MNNQTLQSETLLIREAPHNFPPLREKVHCPSIARRGKESKRQAAKPYYRGGPRINPELLRKLDIVSSAYHRNKQDPLKRGAWNLQLAKLESDIVKDRGGIFDDR